MLLLRVKGDSCAYPCDVRSSRLRLMAGGRPRDFESESGEWTEIEIPFDQCVTNNFGHLLRNVPALDPASLESVRIALADKEEESFEIEGDRIRPLGRPAGREAAAGPLAAVAAKANLHTHLALVKNAELELPKNAKVKIFEPTNDAFAKLPRDQVEFLTSA